MILQPVHYSVGKIEANCPASTVVGDMVYVSADAISGYYQVDRCNIDEIDKRPVGLVVSKRSSTVCTVRLNGIIKDVYTGLTPGKHLFLGAGVGAQLVQSPPGNPSTGKRYHQIAGIALSSNVIDLKIMEPSILTY